MSVPNPEIFKRKLQDPLIDLVYHEMIIDGQPLRYVATSRHGTRRTKTLFIKEPTTVPWIDTFKAGEVVYDVGANVGLYSTYAAAVRKCRVYAFEPEALNYAEVNKNIYINNIDELMTAYCAAVSDEQAISVLHLGSFAIGWSHHDFRENTWTKDKNFGGHVVKREGRMRQGSLSVTLDAMVDSGAAEPPHHIKIDVDGIEARVVRGAKKTIASPTLKTILLEVDFSIPENVALVQQLEDAGWRYSPDQVRINQHEVLPYEKVLERMKKGSGGQNFIFFKDDFYMDYFRDYAASFVPPNPK